MKKCFVITMFDEYSVIIDTINEIFSKFNKESVYICCVHSFEQESNELNSIKEKINSYIQLPNLGKQFSKFELPSQCICRNYSAGFSDVYKNVNDIEYIVALTGDTLVTDANNFERRYEEMKRDKIVARVIQVLGAKFHAAHANPLQGLYKWRRQNYGTTDFFPQLFIIDGNFAKINKAFSNINITNRWSSEQCLGDEMLKHVSKLHYDRLVTRLNMLYKHNSVFAYKDGIKYQQVKREK